MNSNPWKSLANESSTKFGLIEHETRKKKYVGGEENSENNELFSNLNSYFDSLKEIHENEMLNIEVKANLELKEFLDLKTISKVIQHIDSLCEVLEVKKRFPLNYRIEGPKEKEICIRIHQKRDFLTLLKPQISELKDSFSDFPSQEIDQFIKETKTEITKLIQLNSLIEKIYSKYHLN